MFVVMGDGDVCRWRMLMFVMMGDGDVCSDGGW